MLDFSGEDDCYYVQLLRRQSDDPMVDGKPDPAFHGKMHSRSLKDYFIHSLEHFDRVRSEIITLCNTFNVRAYIRLNKRSYRTMSLTMMKKIAEQALSGETYSSPFQLVSSAAGVSHAPGSKKTWILDIDAEYVPYLDQIKDLVSKCAPYPSVEDMVVIPTKNGLHVITTPFNKMDLETFWHTRHPDMPLFDIHKDNPTILYVK